MKALLVDLSSIFWTNWHASSDVELGQAFERTVQRIVKEAQYYEFVAICCDAPPYKRKAISGDYKAQRDAPEPAAIEQLRRVKERLAADGYCLWEAQGYEADDVIASAIEQWSTKEADDPVERVHIFSSDKDLLQLVTPTVQQVSVRDGHTYDEDEVFRKFGVRPELMRDLLALSGDSADNVPGVRGIGHKKAASLLNEWGSVDSILENLAKVKPPGMATALVEHQDSLRISRDLVTLFKDAPIKWNDILEERKPSPIADAHDAEWEDDVEEPESDFDPISPPPPPQERAPSEPPQTEIVTPKPDAIVLPPPAQEWTLQLEPNSIGAAFKLATGIANSRLYTKFSNAEAIMAVIIRGRELGIGALTSLDLFHVVEGRPTMGAHLLVGLVKRSPVCEYFMCTSHDDAQATWETKRSGEPRPTAITYTIDDAQKADLLRPSRSSKPSQWDRRPKTMLRWAAGRELARLVYPDLVGGIYSPDELED